MVTGSLNMFKKHDVLELNLFNKTNFKCLVTEVNFDSFKALPLDPFLNGITSNIFTPKLVINYSSILEYKKLDKLTLMLLVNQESFFVQEAIKSVFYNDEPKSGKS